MNSRLFWSLLAASVLALPQASAKDRAAAPVTVGIAAINDFHGNLEPPGQSVLVPNPAGGQAILVPAGGAAWLASAVDSIRSKYRYRLTVAAGDLTGGSPIASSLYLDEPTIGALNRIGLEFNAVGNHEFDNGIPELLRKQTGGCAKLSYREPCQVERFTGARFQYLAANVKRADGTTLFPASALRTFGSGKRRVRIGLIGMPLQGVAALAPPGSVNALRFADEADTANALVAELKAKGADAVVLLIHQGGRTSGTPDPNGCEGLNADIRPILDRLDPRVDVVISGHTHWTYVCDYARYNPAKPFLLTSAGLWGEAVTDIALDIDPATHRVVAKRARNLIVQSVPYNSPRGRVEINPDYPAFKPRADVAAYVARYTTAARAYTLRNAGSLGGPAEKASGNLQNSGGPLGNLIADAQLAATRSAGAQIAFMNPFGIRRSLEPDAQGNVTFGDIYAVQPFNNDLVTLTYTGAELKAVLEQNFDLSGPEQILAGSAGFSYVYDRSKPEGSRIVAMTLNGAAIDPAALYRVTVSNFLANGGDSYSAFTAGKNPQTGTSDIAALEAWLKAVPKRMPPAEVRAVDARPDLNPVQSTAPPGHHY